MSEYWWHGQVIGGLNELSAERISSTDLVIITNAHTNVDYCLVQENARAIFDTNTAMKNVLNRENIELL